MKAIIEPGNINGIVTTPSSKSMTQRAYAAALLHNGHTIIYNAGRSGDENAALEVIQKLGVTSAPHLQGVAHFISKGVNPISPSINCGESGLCARLFTPIAALCDKPVQIEGTGSLL